MTSHTQACTIYATELPTMPPKTDGQTKQGYPLGMVGCGTRHDTNAYYTSEKLTRTHPSNHSTYNNWAVLHLSTKKPPYDFLLPESRQSLREGWKIPSLLSLGDDRSTFTSGPLPTWRNIM